MGTKTIQQSIESIQQSIDKMIGTVSRLSEEIIRRKPSENEWSIIQILCHVLEAVPYWIGEIAQIKANPAELWGRNHLQEARLAAVADTDRRTVDAVVKELDALKSQVEKELGALDQDTLAITATSRNPNFGTKPISFIIDHLIDEHVSKHCGQIDRSLSKLNE
ncbi:DinB family protein [Bacillus sp. EB600]|uniref:DinB family protein n=1 Tax=Bacillus sp. EB600 TaxID=2806345 RepID=UPI00210E206B|nr:DinB family protein [Bacillus sp. EB600]MCQ6279282.1 DinB family protein [Bacillus sp. EB600]